jgi:hypothetical protein
VPFVLQGSGCGICIPAYCLPNRLTVFPEAEIVDTLLVRFELAIDKGISSPEGMILIPNRVEEWIVSITQTYPNVEAEFQCSHHNS